MSAAVRPRARSAGVRPCLFLSIEPRTLAGEELDDAISAALHGVVHRRHAGIVGGVHVGALVDEDLHHIDRIVAVAGLGHLFVAAARRAEAGGRHQRRRAILEACDGFAPPSTSSFTAARSIARTAR